MWYLIFSDKGDGPGQAIGVLIIGLASLFPFATGIALAAGAIVGAILAPNSAAHPDAREAARLLSSSQSRAGGRER